MVCHSSFFKRVVISLKCLAAFEKDLFFKEEFLQLLIKQKDLCIQGPTL